MKTLNFSLWLCLAAACALGASHARAQYVTATSVDFDTICGTPVADNDPNWTNKRYLLTGNEFFSCGIESIASPGAALGDGAYLYRPSVSGGIDTLAIDPITGLDDTALIGNVGTGIGPIEITFRTPVNELSFTLLDLDDGGSPTITVTDGNGATTTPTFNVSGNQVSFSQEFPGGVKKLFVDYGGALQNYALENLAFNTWDCGDGDPEPEAGEACDDGNSVQCDGTCGNDCQATIDGCLDGATCVAHGTVEAGSGGCAVCDLSQRVPGSDVGYTNAALDVVCDSDGLTCTDDLCSANGACEHRIQDGTCAIGGTCYADGDEAPGNVCRECDSATSKVSFTAVALGEICDDGQFCTESDQCNGSGACVGMTRDCSDTATCTVDTCDEANDACLNTVAVGCFISGACVANGEENPNNPCEVCDRDSALADWTTVPAGSQCGDPSCLGGVLTPAPLCDASGSCETQPTETCDGAVCANEESCTGTCQTDADCLEQNHCESGECVPDEPNGSPCTRAEECTSGFCADGVCCSAACDRVCESCALEGKVGMCEGHAVGTDPDMDCGDAEVCASPGLCVPEDRPNGTTCDRDAVCKSRHCVDGVCCDTACDGACEACNVASKEGACTPFDIGTDPADECSGEQVCNGASACVGYETRGNGLCATAPGPSRSTPWWLCALGVLAGAAVRRRNKRERA